MKIVLDILTTLVKYLTTPTAKSVAQSSAKPSTPAPVAAPVPALAQEPELPISQKALDLIIKHEVGGGEAYYNKALKKPCYPGGASGVTIGVGYDLGYNTDDQFTSDWGKVLSGDIFSRLSKCLGAKSSSAKSLIPSVKDIEIPWESALKVFKESTLPRFVNETLKAFPGANELHPDAFGALVSLVFNRGAAVTGKNREEMKNIRGLIAGKDYAAIAKEITNMKRIWVGKGLDGLLRRRDEEAALVKGSTKAPIVTASTTASAPAAAQAPLAVKLVELARKEIGVQEVNGTNCGPRVNEYKSATSLDPEQGWPWCAAFICWLMREAMKDNSYTFKRPTTASAWGFEDWAAKQNNKVQLKKPHKDDIKAGDIVMFTFSHIGLAISDPQDGYIDTIEGNTDGQGSREGGAVLLKKRKLSAIRSRIRITV
jgi:hypothetical protein